MFQESLMITTVTNDPTASVSLLKAFTDELNRFVLYVFVLKCTFSCLIHGTISPRWEWCLTAHQHSYYCSCIMLWMDTTVSRRWTIVMAPRSIHHSVQVLHPCKLSAASTVIYTLIHYQSSSSDKNVHQEFPNCIICCVYNHAYNDAFVCKVTSLRSAITLEFVDLRPTNLLLT